MNGWKNFFKTVWLALNPWRYDELEDYKGTKVFAYFLKFTLFMLAISFLLFIPTLVGFVGNQMEHFDVFEVEFNTSMNSAVVYPEGDPIFTIDTRTSEGELTEGKVLVTDDYVYRKAKFGNKVYKIPISRYENLAENQDMIVTLLVLILPSIVFYAFLGCALKAFLIALLATLLGFIVARMIQFQLSFKDNLKVALLAATPMLIIGLATKPFNINIYGAQYIAFAIFFIVGFIKAGSFEGTSKPSKKGKRRGGRKSKHSGRYVELKVPKD